MDCIGNNDRKIVNWIPRKEFTTSFRILKLSSTGGYGDTTRSEKEGMQRMLRWSDDE